MPAATLKTLLRTRELLERFSSSDYHGLPKSGPAPARRLSGDDGLGASRRSLPKALIEISEGERYAGQVGGSMCWHKATGGSQAGNDMHAAVKRKRRENDSARLGDGE